MFSFLSCRKHRSDQVAARAVICLFALLFFISAALSALPSFSALSSLTDFLADKGLAGYTAEAQTEAPNEFSEALESYTDRPFPAQTSGTEESISSSQSAPVAEKASV